MAVVGASEVLVRPTFTGAQKAIGQEFGRIMPGEGKEASRRFSSGFAGNLPSGIRGGVKVAATATVATFAGAGALAGAAIAKGISANIAKGKSSDLLAAQIGLSPGQSERAGKVAGAVFRDAYGGSLEEVNGALRGVQTNIGKLGTFSNAELESMTGKALDLSTVMGVDVDQATRGVGQLMRNGMAPDAEAAFDIITAASQRLPESMQGELLETIEEYSADLSSLGLSGEEAFGSITASVEAGARNTDLAADALREFSIRSVDGSKASAEGYKALGLNAEDMAAKIAAGGPSAKKATSEIIRSLAGMSDPVAQEAAGVALFGTRYEELGIGAIAALDPMASSLGDVSGAASEMGDTLNDNFATRLEGWKRKAAGFVQDGLSLMLKGFDDGKASGEGFTRFLTASGAKASEVFTELTGGIRAFGFAWRQNDGDVTSSGFPGYMERLGYVARQAFEQARQGVTAFGAAWRYNDGEVTSSGFPGFMERLGYAARQAFDYLKGTAVPAVQSFVAGIRSGEGPGGKFAEILNGIKTNVSNFFAVLRTQDLSAFTGGLSSAGNILTGLQPTLNAAGKVMQFLGRHVDLLALALPALITGFVAYKGLQAANNVLGRQSIVGFGLQIGSTVAMATSNFALSKSLKSVNVAQAQNTVSTAAGTATQNASAVATTRKTIASRVATVATKAWAGAQRVLNLVLTNNPIGWYIKGLTLLAAGLVLAYRNSDEFRVVVDRAWTRVKAVAASTVSWFVTKALPAMSRFFSSVGSKASQLYSRYVQPAFAAVGRVVAKVLLWLINTGAPLAGKALTWVGAKAMGMWRSYVSPAFSAVWSIAKRVFGWVRNTGWPIMSTALQFVGNKAIWLYNKVYRPYFGFILSKVRSVFGWVRDTGYPIMRNALQKVGDKASWLWRKGVAPAMSGIRSVIKSAWNKASDVFASFRSGVGKVKDAFSTAASGISTAWGKVKQYVAKPVVAVLGFVNSGIIGGLNKVLGWAGAKKISKINIPAGLSAAASGRSAGGQSGSRSSRGGSSTRFGVARLGAVLPGYSPGVDNLSFNGPAGRLDLSGGEAIMVPEWTRAVGKAGVYAMNKLARRSGPQAVRDRLGMARGGVFNTSLQKRIKEERQLYVRDAAPGFSIAAAARAWNGITDLVLSTKRAAGAVGMGAFARPGSEFRNSSVLGSTNVGTGRVILNRDANWSRKGNNKRGTAVHELGHVLGMGHPGGRGNESVMRQTKDRFGVQSPTISDKSWLRSIFPRRKTSGKDGDTGVLGNIASAVKSGIGGAAGFMKSPLSYLKGLLAKGISGLAGNPFSSFARGAAGRVADAAKDKLLGYFNSPGGGGVGTIGGVTGTVGARTGRGILAMFRNAGFAAPVRAGGLYRAGQGVKSGLSRSRHSIFPGLALDTPPNKRLQDWAWERRRRFRELYLPDGRGWLLGGLRSRLAGWRTTMANHMGRNAHIHAAYERGGVVPHGGQRPKVYDQGGILPPGGMGVNLSSKPELVLTQDQVRKMGSTATPVYVQNPFTGEYLLAKVAEVADSRVRADGNTRTRALHAGVR